MWENKSSPWTQIRKLPLTLKILKALLNGLVIKMTPIPCVSSSQPNPSIKKKKKGERGERERTNKNKKVSMELTALISYHVRILQKQIVTNAIFSL